MNDSAFMKEHQRRQIDKGRDRARDAWLAGAIASKKGCIRKPDDIRGLKVRSAGPTFARCGSRRRLDRLDPVERGLNALQTGRRRRTDTSSAASSRFRIYEQCEVPHRAGRQRAVVHVRAVLMSKKSFSAWTGTAGSAAAAGRKSQEFFAQGGKGLDDEW